MIHLRLKENSALDHPLFEVLKKGAQEQELEDLFAEELAFFYHLKPRLIHSVVFKDKTLLDVVPFHSLGEGGSLSLEQKVRLSRFCYLHDWEGDLVLETPLCPVKVIVKDLDSLKFLFGKAAFPEEVTRECLKLLSDCKMLETADEREFPLLAWEFHDLLFAARSREGRHNHPAGAHYPFKGKIPPLPAVKKRTYSEVIPLFTPNIEELKNKDIPFTYVLEERKSKREQANLLTDKQLGEFLYRSARIKEIGSNPIYEQLFRPFPSGGAIHETEIYLIIHQCTNIAPGLYHYQALNHELGKISAANELTNSLLRMSQQGTGKNTPPQILFIFAARFQRFSWKYQSIAYACMLKNCGVLMQTMYLVATAMKLSPCAVGCGDSDLFAKAAGLNYYEETSIGEFILS